MISAYTNSVTSPPFMPPVSEEGAGAWSWRRHRQDSWPQWTQGFIYNIIWHHSEQKPEGKLALGQWLLPGDWVGIGQWVHNCIVQSLFCIPCYHYCYFPLPFCPIKLSLSQPLSRTLFPVLSQISLEEGEKAAVWGLAAWQVKHAAPIAVPFKLQWYHDCAKEPWWMLLLGKI